MRVHVSYSFLPLVKFILRGRVLSDHELMVRQLSKSSLGVGDESTV